VADSRVDAYAEALLEVAQAEGALETVENELFKVARTIEGSDELRNTLGDENIPVERRVGVVQDVLTNAHPTTRGLVSFLVRPLLSGLLDDSQRERLAEALSRATGRQVSVKVIVDESVIGGIVAQVGDQVIDGSVRNRLNQLREAL
jgi:F-type H+-transporting ATPase subunit delta